VAVPGLHHRDLRSDALEPHHAVHSTALDRPLALQLESELEKERRHGREVVDHNAHVLYALDRHALDGKDTTAPTASLDCRSLLEAGEVPEQPWRLRWIEPARQRSRLDPDPPRRLVLAPIRAY
jgi:hypothetical protein